MLQVPPPPDGHVGLGSEYGKDQLAIGEGGNHDPNGAMRLGVEPECGRGVKVHFHTFIQSLVLLL